MSKRAMMKKKEKDRKKQKALIADPPEFEL